MTSHRERDFSPANKMIGVGWQNCTPVSPQKVVNLCGHCIGIQCFTVERLGEQGGDRMESLLSELEEFVETLDLAPEEESKIARILEKLRDEATVSA